MTYNRGYRQSAHNHPTTDVSTVETRCVRCGAKTCNTVEGFYICTGCE